MLAIQQKRPKHNAISATCPACGSRAGVYCSRPVSNETRELFFHCANPDCDATFRAVLTVLNYIIDSLMPEGDPRRLQGDEQGPPMRVSRPRSQPTKNQPERPRPASPEQAIRRRITHD